MFNILPPLLIILGITGLTFIFKNQKGEKGKKITGLDEANKMEDVTVFHAGTAEENGDIVTAGGRVLGVTALGDTVAEAKAQAYKAVEKINFDGAYCRKDIADKAID